jgi:hypothetical protein
MAGTYGATPEGFVEQHPVLASNIAAAAGPLGIPIIAAMAMKTAHEEGSDDSIDWGKKVGKAAGAVGRDIPGLRLMEDVTGRGFPEGFARNYLSGYTNFARPAALGYDWLRGKEGEPDVSSPDLSGFDRIFNRARSNIPGPIPFGRDSLPRKDGGENDLSTSSGDAFSDYWSKKK